MLAFITSLRHPLNSTDYARVEDLLRVTLGSVVGQTSNEFVVVVGNQRPAFPLPDRVQFVQVNFPPPSAQKGPMTPREEFKRDKGQRLELASRRRERTTPISS